MRSVLRAHVRAVSSATQTWPDRRARQAAKGEELRDDGWRSAQCVALVFVAPATAGANDPRILTPTLARANPGSQASGKANSTTWR
jgi:hypothetical protein